MVVVAGPANQKNISSTFYLCYRCDVYRLTKDYLSNNSDLPGLATILNPVFVTEPSV